MSWFERIAVVAVCLATSWAQASAAALEEVRSGDLVKILNDLEILATLDPSVDPEATYHIQVYRVRDDGECDGKPDTCPKEVVYIAISDLGDSPEARNVYALPPAYGWTFEHWTHVATSDAPVDYTEFVVTEKLLGEDPARSWWKTVRRVVRVSTAAASIEAVNYRGQSKIMEPEDASPFRD